MTHKSENMHGSVKKETQYLRGGYRCFLLFLYTLQGNRAVMRLPVDTGSFIIAVFIYLNICKQSFHSAEQRNPEGAAPLSTYIKQEVIET